MTALILALIAEAALGGAVVCAEARGLGTLEQQAIGAVVAERVAQTGRNGVDVLTARRQFARPCPMELVEARHVWAYVVGRTGHGPAWAHGAVGFCTPAAAERVGARWRARGWTLAHEAPGHVYWRGTL